MEQFIHLTRLDFVSKKARPPLPSMELPHTVCLIHRHIMNSRNQNTRATNLTTSAPTHEQLHSINLGFGFAPLKSRPPADLPCVTSHQDLRPAQSLHVISARTD